MKTNMKRIFLPAAIFLGVIVQAQDVHFSQLSETPLLLNPANTALGNDFFAAINYKDQWRAVTAPYRTFNVGAGFALAKKKNGNHLGLGFNVFSDKAGDGGMGTTTGDLHFSGVVAANDNNFLSGGLSAGFGQRSLNYGKLYWDNQYDGMQYDATLPTGEPTTFANYGYFDLSAGLGWHYSEGHSTLSSNDARIFTAGIAVHHINRPVYSYYGDTDQKLPMNIVAHGNAAIGLKNHSLVLEPAYLLMFQGAHREINAGLMFKYITQEASKYTGRKNASAVALGGYYRFKDAIAAEARYEFSNWAIGMSYDINMSDLSTASHARGGLEISVRFLSPNPFGGAGHSTGMFN